MQRHKQALRCGAHDRCHPMICPIPVREAFENLNLKIPTATFLEVRFDDVRYEHPRPRLEDRDLSLRHHAQIRIYILKCLAHAAADARALSNTSGRMSADDKLLSLIHIYICIPALPEAQKTTGEAELGIIMGKKCKFIEEKDWENYIVGYTTILDMTEESILRLNPRYLTIVKGFDTFFTFGPQLVTPDEVPDVSALEVQTVHNGQVHAANTVSNMTHSPARLVSLISHMQGWLPGDVLSTGTPRAVHIQDGDTIECRILGPNGFRMEPLVNPVIDLKIRER